MSENEKKQMSKEPNVSFYEALNESLLQKALEFSEANKKKLFASRAPRREWRQPTVDQEQEPPLIDLTETTESEAAQEPEQAQPTPQTGSAKAVAIPSWAFSPVSEPTSPETAERPPEVHMNRNSPLISILQLSEAQLSETSKVLTNITKKRKHASEKVFERDALQVAATPRPLDLTYQPIDIELMTTMNLDIVEQNSHSFDILSLENITPSLPDVLPSNTVRQGKSNNQHTSPSTFEQGRTQQTVPQCIDTNASTSKTSKIVPGNSQQTKIIANKSASKQPTNRKILPSVSNSDLPPWKRYSRDWSSPTQNSEPHPELQSSDLNQNPIADTPITLNSNPETSIEKERPLQTDTMTDASGPGVIEDEVARRIVEAYFKFKEAYDNEKALETKKQQSQKDSVNIHATAPTQMSSSQRQEQPNNVSPCLAELMQNKISASMVSTPGQNGEPSIESKSQDLDKPLEPGLMEDKYIKQAIAFYQRAQMNQRNHMQTNMPPPAVYNPGQNVLPNYQHVNRTQNTANAGMPHYVTPQVHTPLDPSRPNIYPYTNSMPSAQALQPQPTQYLGTYNAGAGAGYQGQRFMSPGARPHGPRGRRWWPTSPTPSAASAHTGMPHYVTPQVHTPLDPSRPNIYTNSMPSAQALQPQPAQYPAYNAGVGYQGQSFMMPGMPHYVTPQMHTPFDPSRPNIYTNSMPSAQALQPQPAQYPAYNPGAGAGYQKQSFVKPGMADKPKAPRRRGRPPKALTQQAKEAQPPPPLPPST